MTIAKVLTRSYVNFASEPAVSDARRSLTYGELADEATRLSALLAACNAQPGDRVAIVVANRVEFFVAEHAAFLSGLVRVGLSPRAHTEEVLFVVRDSGAKFLFVDDEWDRQLEQHRHELGSVRMVNVDDESFAVDLELAGTSEDPYVPGPDDIAALLYTSGSTGKPKGAIHTQRSVAAIARNHLTEIQPIDESDVVLHIGPLAHMSGVFSWAFFAKGAAHHIVNGFDPAAVLELVGSRSVTALMLVPTMLNRLTATAKEQGFVNSSIRTIMYGASPISPEKLALAIEVFGDVFIQAYGQSECQLISALSRSGHRASPTGSFTHLASAGKASPFVEVDIVDNEGVARPGGEEGEIVIRSDTVMEGYFGRPGETREAFFDGDWLRTGDIGRFGSDGCLYITDRRRDMIVTGGYNVYPAEVENVISRVPGVFEVAVVGVPDERWGEAVTAVVQLGAGEMVEPELIVQACRDSLASYKVPKQVHFMDELPKSAVGKISRKDVREQFWSGLSRRVS